MANTFKFGNGEWAVGKETVLAYNDENNNFKPLPFTFDRASTATVVNKDGLIETVGIDEPRIDYTDSSNGVALLEPARTNDIERSEEFDNTYWTKYDTSVTANQETSPNGSVTADKIIEDTGASTHIVGRAFGFTSGTTYSVSVFAKHNGRNLQVSAGNTSTWAGSVKFDLENGVVLSEANGTGKIENFGNGWFRCIVTGTAGATASTNINFGLLDNQTTSYTGDGTSGVYLFGAMRETGSYATSYIPTSGQSGGVTRSAETCSQTPPSGIIGQTEGVLYFESKINAQGTYTGITLSDGTTNNEIIIRFTSTDRIEYYLRSGGTQPIAEGTTLFDTDEYVKVAFAYKSGDSAVYINGTQVTTSTTTTMPVSLTKIKMSRGNNTGVFSGKVKDLKVYNTRLSNSELATLTTI